METGEYWTHNTAYHRWILSFLDGGSRVLDVGCGDGLLLRRISEKCALAVGVDADGSCVQRARVRLCAFENAAVHCVKFEDFDAPPHSFDAVIFAASLHHMDLTDSLRKAKSLLAHGGRLIAVGCARSSGFADRAADCLRVIPAKLGSLLHGECRDIGVPVTAPALSLAEIRRAAKAELPGVKIRRALYWRYLLLWVRQ